MEINTLKSKLRFLNERWTDEQKKLFKTIRDEEYKHVLINACYEYAKTNKTKISIAKKYNVNKRYFKTLTMTKRQRDKAIKQTKYDLYTFIDTHLTTRIKGGKTTRNAIVKFGFKMTETNYKQMIFRYDFINKASVLLYMAGISIESIEAGLHSRRKSFKTINQLLKNEISIEEFLEFAKTTFENFNSNYGEYLTTEIIICEMKNFISRKKKSLFYNPTIENLSLFDDL